MRITSEEKQEILDMYVSGKYHLTEIAEWIGCSYSTVRKIVGEWGYGKVKTNKL